MPSPDDQTQSKQWMKSIGLGFEFAAIVGICGYGGHWADGRFDSRPWGLLIGLLLGLSAGIYQLLKATGNLGTESQRKKND